MGIKIAVNRCFGGFGLSKKAYAHMGLEWDDYGYKYSGHDQRTDPVLVSTIEALGGEASGSLARLEIVEIPDGVEWVIDEYDGVETIHEVHQSW